MVVRIGPESRRYTAGSRINRIPDAGYLMLDVGRWLLVTGYWILDAAGAIPDFTSAIAAGAQRIAHPASVANLKLPR